MNMFSGLLLERLQVFAGSHPTVAILAAGMGAALLGLLACFRVNYVLREKAISLNAKRFETLMDVLKADKVDTVHPLYLELAFQRAFGRKQSSDEIVFALNHNNPGRLLFDMWHGRTFVKLNDEKTGFVLKRQGRFSLRMRERIADAILYFVLTPGFLFCLLYSLVEPTIGLVFLTEIVIFFWVMLVAARSFVCAQRLLERQHADDLRKSEVVPRRPSASIVVAGELVGDRSVALAG